MSVSRPTESAVIITVPEAEPVVAPHRKRLDTAASWGVPAHVTVLYPFVSPDQIDAEVVAKLATVVAAVTPFEASYRTTGWFDDTVLWIAPEPDVLFRALILAVAAAFPECPPYGGAFGLDEVVPHLTVGHDAGAAELRAAERDVAHRLPFTAQIGSVDVMCGSSTPNSWRTIATLPLGRSHERAAD